MINVNVDVDVNVNLAKSRYPFFFFKRNECIHCGARGALKFVNKFGSVTTKDMYPFDHIICTHCNTEYSILWEKDDNGKMIPCAVDESFKQDFINFLRTKSINQSAQKVID